MVSVWSCNITLPAFIRFFTNEFALVERSSWRVL